MGRGDRAARHARNGVYGRAPRAEASRVLERPAGAVAVSLPCPEHRPAKSPRANYVRARAYYAQRVSAGPAVVAITVGTRRLAPEVRAILLAVGRANRRAIDAVQRQPAPPIAITWSR
jgi:hypothetical protein